MKARSPTLISAGIVYRFIHKPMSPGSREIVCGSGHQEVREQRRRAAESPRQQRSQGSMRAWLIGGADRGL